MGELGRWVAWVSGALMGQVFDPMLYVAIVLGVGFGQTWRRRVIGLILVLVIAGAGWWTVLDYQQQIGSGAPPVSHAVLYVVGKILGFALGLAFNRVIQRIEKRSTRVLEKTRI